MKSVGLLLLFVALAAGQAADVSLATRQHDILALLFRPSEPMRNILPDGSDITELKEAGSTYHPSEHLDRFKDGGEAAIALDKRISDGRVHSKKTLFSLFNTEDRKEALMIVDVLLNAQCWCSFIKSAAYYREHMNEGAFIYAFYVSITHSTQSKGTVLPPLYEVTPHMFTNSEIIHKAYTAKMTQKPGKFRMDFTGSLRNPEQRVAYFAEDIGMNVHHVIWHMDFPFWWDDHYGSHMYRKGELFFWMHHQLTVRYDAERLSNHLSLVDELYWDKPIVEGFAPHTSYKYGGDFPARPDNVYFQDVDGIARIRDMMIMEDRIRDAIAHGYVTSNFGHVMDIRNEAGIDVLGDLMESSAYSPNPEYYGSFHNTAHMILGRQSDPIGKYNQPPGVMEHFETATRDPAFFRLHKIMDNILKEHKDSLPPYTNYELLFPGVSIDSVTIDGNLETFFEDFEFGLHMAVDTTPGLDDIDISAIVKRLNHYDFSASIDITNNHNDHKDVLGTVRTFLCPLKDDNGIVFSLNEARWHCIEMDKFWTTLHPGKNHIVRKSKEVSSTSPDIPSFRTLWDTAKDAMAAGTEPDFGDYSSGCGIPNRMLLPKGTADGLEFSLIVVVTDGSRDAAVEGLEDNHDPHTLCGVRGGEYPDKRPLGFPLDRKIHKSNERVVLTYPNFSRTIVSIKHH